MIEVAKKASFISFPCKFFYFKAVGLVCCAYTSSVRVFCLDMNLDNLSKIVSVLVYTSKCSQFNLSCFPRFYCFITALTCGPKRVFSHNFDSFFLQAIPPVTRMALTRDTWVTVLCRKLRDWWHWVSHTCNLLRKLFYG